LVEPITDPVDPGRAEKSKAPRKPRGKRNPPQKGS
jgi:hypothetical protein